MTEDYRHSRPKRKASLPKLSDSEVAEREAYNSLQQFTRALEEIEGVVGTGNRFRLRPSLILELNRKALFGLEEDAGAYRTYPMEIEGSGHNPPPERQVPLLVDEMCEYVNDNWDCATAIHLAAYVMWRMNWIHPFGNGNGRTSRTVAYIVLSAKLGYLLPGTLTIPALIAEDKNPYYSALEAADRGWDDSNEPNVTGMESLLETLLARQLLQVIDEAAGGHGPVQGE